MPVGALLPILAAHADPPRPRKKPDGAWVPPATRTHLSHKLTITPSGGETVVKSGYTLTILQLEPKAKARPSYGSTGITNESASVLSRE
jgi:hypothetical protein